MLKRLIESEAGVGFVIAIVIGGALFVATLTLSNYLIHGDISVACQYMALPQAACQ